RSSAQHLEHVLDSRQVPQSPNLVPTLEPVLLRDGPQAPNRATVRQHTRQQRWPEATRLVVGQCFRSDAPPGDKRSRRRGRCREWRLTAWSAPAKARTPWPGLLLVGLG